MSSTHIASILFTSGIAVSTGYKRTHRKSNSDTELLTATTRDANDGNLFERESHFNHI